MEENNVLEERKIRLLGYIESAEYIPLRRKEIRQMISVPDSEREQFEGMVLELINEGKVVETKKGKLLAPKTINMSTGTFTGHAKGFGFVTPDEGGADIFIPANETAGAMQKDKVLYKVIRTGDKDKKSEGVIIKVLERGITRVVGLYEQSKGFGFVIADDKKIAKDIFIAKENAKGAVSGHKVVAEIINYAEERRNPEGKIIEILGHINDPGVDILSVIRQYDLAVEFPDEVYKEIENLETEVSEKDKAGREDFRGLLTITIDGEDAKDLDDAVSLTKTATGNYMLGVHIADVTHYVREHTALDREGYARGTSVYLVDRVIPMLPHKLSNGICSLNPHTDRLAMSCMMEIDAKGNVVDHKICESVIYSDYRMTYTAVRELIEDKTPALLEEFKEILPMLTMMNELRQVLGEKRKRRGSVNFDLPESKIILNEQGKPIDIHPYERSIATNLIEEFMLVCNETVAENAFWQEIPFLYRTHLEPDEEKLQRMEQFIRGFGYHLRKKDGEVHPREIQRVLLEAEGTEQERIITRMILRSMMQARYGADNLGHFGLAAKYYCHFTSPIRRYPDLQIHRLLKKMLHGELKEAETKEYKKKMPDIGKHCSKRERIADDAERDTDQLKKVEYMEDKIGEAFEGIISGVTNWGIYVELPNTIEGMVALAMLDDDYYEFDEKKMVVFGRKSGKIYRLGDKVTVVVAKVSKELRTIDFLFDDGEE
ncbi:ribonuclease R [Anaerotignum neopropionicum]|uniref:Ribonuclease R n=1 Tax=Anaerotignum neopropionicum TaxID=36847 RepID=A0A136WAV5_9FIRM|nr:ribonuclease R [Anaerotignum neopropionicum]KXL51648.1 ribonuclease R [Anaerotignum neopropionicum]